MAEDWKAGYHKALEEFLKGAGMFVRKGDSIYYGWADYAHSGGMSGTRCAVVSVDMSTLKEETIGQFAGTFVSSEMESGIEVLATCACGKYVNGRLRWTGSLTEVLNHLLRS